MKTHEIEQLLLTGLLNLLMLSLTDVSYIAVSKKLENGCRMIYAGFPWDQRTVMLQLSGFYCRLPQLPKKPNTLEDSHPGQPTHSGQQADHQARGELLTSRALGLYLLNSVDHRTLRWIHR